MDKKCKDCAFLQKAIRENQEKYQELVENINDVIFQVDKKGKILYISPIIFRLTGYHPKEIIGRNFKEFILKKDLHGLMDSWKRFWAGEDVPYEFRIITKKGTPLYVKTYSQILRKDGTDNSLVGVMTDISWRKKTELSLRENEEKLKMILEDLPMFIYRFRPNGEITYANKNYCDYLKIKNSKLIGKNIFSLLPKNEKNAFRKRIKGLTLQTPNVQYEVSHNSGKSIHHHGWTDRAIFNSKGKIIAFQSIGRDITEKKEAQRRLVASYQYLGTINRRVSVLLDLNETVLKKRKKEALNHILWSALEISSAESACLYFPDKKESVFNLLTAVSRNKLSPQDKSKMKKLSAENHLIGQLKKKKSCEQMFKSDLGNLKKKSEIKYFLILPLLKKRKLSGFFLLGFSEKRKLDDQEVGFLKVFTSHAFSLLSEIGKIR